MGVQTGADGRKCGNSQPGCAHGNQSYRFFGLIAPDWALLQHRAQAKSVQRPLWNFFNRDSHLDRRAVRREWIIIRRPFHFLIVNDLAGWSLSNTSP